MPTKTAIMKKSFFVFCPLLFGSILLLQSTQKDDQSATVAYDKQSMAIGCAPADDEARVNSSGKFIGVLPGWRRHHYAISTVSDSAQFYFNQGLTMYYSYHSREAVASFREAARFDSTSAMVYWGQALAQGPSYNYGYSYKMNKSIPAVLEKMNQFAIAASGKEKDLIETMKARYNVADTSDKQRTALNIAYADALRSLVAKNPTDIDIKALYTDAVMLTHAWDFWHNDGRPKEWTPELVRHCEAILAVEPQHPGALHYYIHVTEASRNPEIALPAADSLIQLYPGIAHMVHMSSHEYERIGYYAKGVDANEKADLSMALYDSLAKGLYPQVHVPHYYAVDAYCALSGGMYKKGVQKSLATRKLALPTINVTYFQYLYMFPQLHRVRLGKWQDILSDTTRIRPEWNYAGLLDDFAKGMAWSKVGDAVKAEMYLQQLQEKQLDEKLKERFVPYTSSPYEVSQVAENILLATIRYNQKNYQEAIAAIRDAIRAEDNILYSEPKLWMLPARQYLGVWLMQLNKPKEAEKVYREDLVWNPGNGWSLLGLYQALKAQGKKAELASLQKKYMYSFSEADVIPAASAY